MISVVNLLLNCGLCIFISYFIDIYNTLLLLISIDNFAYAINFILYILNRKYDNKDNHKQIIIENNNLYFGSTYERYMFYILSYIIYNLIYYFVTEHSIIKYLICFAIIPDIYNHIYIKYNNCFLLIKEYITYILKIFLAEQVTNIIKYLSEKYIDDISIDKEHIKETLLETDTLISEIYLFIKNFFIVLLMMYSRSKSIFYYKIIKYIYIYNSGNYYITNIDLEKCKSNLKQIIEDKNYKKFNEPQIIQSMLYLYYSKKDDKFDIIIDKINYNLIEFFTLWTIGSFFNLHYRLSVVIVLWQAFNFNLQNYNSRNNIIPIFLTSLIYCVNSNIIILSFVIQFSNPIIFNRITKSFYNTIYININNNIMKNKAFIFKILHQNLLPFAKYYIFAFVLKYILYKNKIQYIHYTCLFWMFITNIDRDLYSNYLYLILYLSIINKNHIIKIFILSYILSLINNFIKWKINDNNMITFEDIKIQYMNIKNLIYTSTKYKNNSITHIENVQINDMIDNMIDNKINNTNNNTNNNEYNIIEDIEDAIRDDSPEDINYGIELIENYL